MIFVVSMVMHNDYFEQVHPIPKKKQAQKSGVGHNSTLFDTKLDNC